MLTKEQVEAIHHLRSQGYAIKKIARELGTARNTVRKYLALGSDHAPKYTEREKRPGKLDPYKAYLQRRTHEAGAIRIPASLLYEEIKALGYTGKIKILRSYLATLTAKSTVKHSH